MKQFLFIYRMDFSTIQNRTAEQAALNMQQWMEWLKGIGAQNKLVTKGDRLHNTGKVVKSNNVVTNGPYTDVKESIGGYSIIKSDSYDEAVAFAKGCPVFKAGGSVEVREIDVM